jgi:hypothetical protein
MATKYLVLSKDSSGFWNEAETVTAVSADAAIRVVAVANGTFAAVPARSWKPRKVTLEVKERLTLS